MDESSDFVGHRHCGFHGGREGGRGAAETRDTLAEFNRNLPTESRVHYRFGVASGEISEGADGPSGQAVEHAATLSLRAQPDAVRLSESVQAALPADFGACDDESRRRRV